MMSDLLVGIPPLQEISLEQVAQTVNVTCVAGNTVSVRFGPVEISGVQTDLTSYTIICQIRTPKPADALKLAPTVNLYAPGNSVFGFDLTPTNTLTNIGVGSYIWAGQWTDPSGHVLELWRGSFTIIDRIVH